LSQAVRSIRARRLGFERERGAVAVEAEEGLCFVRVPLETAEGHEAAALGVLRPLAERGLCIRFLRIFPGCLSFLAAGEDLPAARAALVDAGVPVEASVGCAVVTVFAPNMRSIPGLMARMGEALYARAIDVYQTADSHSSVSCVVAAEQLADAIDAVRGEFGLTEEGP
jgi:aspartokinase